jgi:hypothetical protein
VCNTAGSVNNHIAAASEDIAVAAFAAY